MQLGLALEAGLLYAFTVFAVGSIIGTVRTLLLAPRIGAIAAVTLEMPVMLTVSWLTCSWIVGRFQVPLGLTTRLGMGLVAFSTLMLLELGLSVVAFHRSVGEHFAGYHSLPSRIGLAGQIVFAVFPFYAN